MDKLTIDDFKKMLRNALVCITERSDEFSKLDAVLGDGDHGTAIVQSMSALVATADKGTEFKSMLNDMSFNLMLEISGSTSTLLGGFFLGMSDHAEGTELNVAGLKAMFAGGLEGVRKQTKAKQGDKTMMDALIPAVEAIQACDSADVKAILTEAGLDISDVVKTTVFLADMGDFGAMNEVYASQFEGAFPARSAVAVKTLPKNGLVEIEVIAVKA